MQWFHIVRFEGNVQMCAISEKMKFSWYSRAIAPSGVVYSVNNIGLSTDSEAPRKTDFDMMTVYNW